MRMNQIISNIETMVNAQENRAEELCDEREQIVSREAEIKNAVQQLEDDIAVSGILRKNMSEAEMKKEDVSRKIEEFGREMNDVLSQIDEEESKAANSANTIHELESMGEQIGNSKSVLSERMYILKNCRERIGQMLSKLGDAFPGHKESSQANVRDKASGEGRVSEQPMKNNVIQSREKSGEQKISEFNKMIDESVRKHGEMLKRTHYLPKDEAGEEHASYSENANKAKEDFAAQIKEQYGEGSIENGYTRISAKEIKDFNIGDQSFWDYKSTSKEKYFDMAKKIPEVEQGLRSGKSMEELRQNPELKDTVDAYFDEKNVIIVERDKDGYHFQDNGRHRVAAARELGIDIPVRVIDRPNAR